MSASGEIGAGETVFRAALLTLRVLQIESVPAAGTVGSSISSDASFAVRVAGNTVTICQESIGMARQTLGGVSLTAGSAAALTSSASSVVDVKTRNAFKTNLGVSVGAGEANTFTNSQNTLTIDDEKNLVVGFDQLGASCVGSAV